MKVWLVIDESTNVHISYKNKYRAFYEDDDALEYAKSVGFEDVFGMGLNGKDGVLNSYEAGDTRISAIKVQVQ